MDKKIVRAFNEHRKNTGMICSMACFCWDVEKIIKRARRRPIRRVIERIILHYGGKVTFR